MKAGRQYDNPTKIADVDRDYTKTEDLGHVHRESADVSHVYRETADVSHVYRETADVSHVYKGETAASDSFCIVSKTIRVSTIRLGKAVGQ